MMELSEAAVDITTLALQTWARGKRVGLCLVQLGSVNSAWNMCKFVDRALHIFSDL